MASLDRLCIDTIRTLSIDAVQRAESGHPGAPMGLAPAAYVLWQHHLRHNPNNPEWPDRDRFVLSNGHASMLLYSLLHLTGYDAVTLEEIEQFRQWGSLTPGHPEQEWTPGVETTTGPLGQGFANGVGMALAEAKLNDEFGDIVDHRTYVFCSDGDLMEGISHEAASLAGHLELGKLVYLYDDNQITIDGSTDLTYSEDVEGRFESYGWHTECVEDEDDLEAIDAAIDRAEEVSGRPSLIAVRTTIGYGSPNKSDDAASHGAPLGEEEVRRTKAALGWEWETPFYVPDEVREQMDATEDGRAMEREWRDRLDTLREEAPQRASELTRRLDGDLPPDWDDDMPAWAPSSEGIPTRDAHGEVLERLYRRLPEIVGGSADLAGSNRTLDEERGVIQSDDYAGQCLHFGVREHAMSGIANGMNLHGGVRGFAATFLIFSDYMRPSIRLSALMEQPTLFVFTHDSIGLGEDGPTHQPIEQLSSLRAIPNLTVLRPGDANEVPPCWRLAVEKRSGPSALVLTRQDVPIIDRSAFQTRGSARRGGYVLAEAPGGEPEVVLIATGSEVPLCVRARETLIDEHGLETRVVSMPSFEVFEAQARDWRETVLPSSVDARLAVEAGSPHGWSTYVGDAGEILGIDRYGASAPADVNFEKFGFTPENVARRAREVFERSRS